MCSMVKPTFTQPEGQLAPCSVQASNGGLCSLRAACPVRPCWPTVFRPADPPWLSVQGRYFEGLSDLSGSQIERSRPEPAVRPGYCTVPCMFRRSRAACLLDWGLRVHMQLLWRTP